MKILMISLSSIVSLIEKRAIFSGFNPNKNESEVSNNSNNLLDSYNKITYDTKDIEEEYKLALSELYEKTFNKKEQDIVIVFSKLTHKGIDAKAVQQSFIKKVIDRKKEYEKRKEEKVKEIKNYCSKLQPNKTEEVKKIFSYYIPETAEKKKNILQELGFDVRIIPIYYWSYSYDPSANTSAEYQLWANIDKTDFELLQLSGKL